MFQDWRRPSLPSYPCKVEDVLKPTPPDEWISDYKNRLGDTRKTDYLNSELRKLNSDTRAEFAVVTLEDLGSTHTYGSHPEAYGRFCQDLFDSWGIGRCGVDDGLLLVVFCEGRRIEVVSGKGLTTRTKKLDKRGLDIMQQRVMIPLLKAGNYGGAIEAGTLALADAVRESTLSGGKSSFNDDSGGGRGKQRNDSKRDGHHGGPDSDEIPWKLLLFGAFFGTAYYQYRESRRPCPKCGAQTIKVDVVNQVDFDANEYLSSGEKVERDMGSCTFEFRQCPECGEKTNGRRQVLVVPPFFAECTECGHTTVEIKVRVVPGGKDIVEGTCEYCGNYRTYGESSSTTDDDGGYTDGASGRRHSSRITSFGGESWRIKSSDNSGASHTESSGGFGGGSSRGGSSTSGFGGGSSRGGSSGGFGGGSSSGGASAGSSWFISPSNADELTRDQGDDSDTEEDAASSRE